MLAIRLQRRGRKGRAHFRIVVQDSHLSPKSGNVVAYVGTYDPHTKAVTVDKEEVEKYLTNGAQPSNTVAKLLKQEKVKLPDWVVIDTSQKRAPKKAPEKKEEKPTKTKEAPAEEAAPEAPADDKKAEESKEEKPEEAPTEDKPAEKEAETASEGEEKSEDSDKQEPDSKEDAKEDK